MKNFPRIRKNSRWQTGSKSMSTRWMIDLTVSYPCANRSFSIPSFCYPSAIRSWLSPLTNGKYWCCSQSKICRYILFYERDGSTLKQTGNRSLLELLRTPSFPRPASHLLCDCVCRDPGRDLEGVLGLREDEDGVIAPAHLQQQTRLSLSTYLSQYVFIYPSIYIYIPISLSSFNLQLPYPN